jgi:hypothetical protein
VIDSRTLRRPTRRTVEDESREVYEYSRTTNGTNGRYRFAALPGFKRDVSTRNTGKHRRHISSEGGLTDTKVDEVH